jgi:hypothetical protein
VEVSIFQLKKYTQRGPKVAKAVQACAINHWSMFKNTLSVEKEYHILSLGSFIYFQEFLTAEVLEIR